MSAAPLKYLTVAATTKHTATVIFVHGLGDSGHGWKPVADTLKADPSLQHVKWVLPHAPNQAVTANFGMVMPAWFDLRSFELGQEEDEKGLLESSKKLGDLISAEVDSGISSERIVLGGFSQGGAMALLTGLTSERKLGGIAVLSGFLPLSHKFKGMLSDHAKTIPIFWGHGADDPLVRAKFATRSVEFLRSQCNVSETDGEALAGLKFKMYPGLEHSSSPEELSDLKSWLKSVVPNSKEDA